MGKRDIFSVFCFSLSKWFTLCECTLISQNGVPPSTNTVVSSKTKGRVTIHLKRKSSQSHAVCLKMRALCGWLCTGSHSSPAGHCCGMKKRHGNKWRVETQAKQQRDMILRTLQIKEPFDVMKPPCSIPQSTTHQPNLSNIRSLQKKNNN